MPKKCPVLFSHISQPPDKIKEAWRKMIPEWAWNAMVDDTVNIIRREAFFPETFLADIAKEACKKMKSKR